MMHSRNSHSGSSSDRNSLASNEGKQSVAEDITEDGDYIDEAVLVALDHETIWWTQLKTFCRPAGHAPT